MLADAEDVEADLIGELDLLHEIAEALGRIDAPPGFRVGAHLGKGVNAQFHACRPVCLLRGSHRGGPGFRRVVPSPVAC